VAIDPKPMLGEPKFDVPPFLWNPLGSLMTWPETERRLSAFADAGLNRTRMRQWALIRGPYQCVGDWIGGHVVKFLKPSNRLELRTDPDDSSLIATLDEKAEAISMCVCGDRVSLAGLWSRSEGVGRGDQLRAGYVRGDTPWIACEERTVRHRGVSSDQDVREDRIARATGATGIRVRVSGEERRGKWNVL
jgi:hypothetical protein